MKRSIFIPLSLILILFAGCDAINSGDNPNAVFLRVANNSNINFSSVVVGFPQSEASYGTIPAGKATEYHQVDAVYSYGYVKVKADESTYKIQPIDFVGEEPLGNGYYTYKLNINKNQLTGKIVKD